VFSAAILKRILPRSLFGRALLIIVMPLILLQIVSTYIFFERHWETITRRLAGAVAGEIALVIAEADEFQDLAAADAMLRRIGPHFGIPLAYRGGDILPNVRDESRFGQTERVLKRELENRLRRPVLLDPDLDPRSILVRVQLTDGVLDAVIDRGRLFSSTTYIFIIWMVGTSILLFAIAGAFMRNQVRPIRRLAHAVDRFGKGREVGDFKPAGAAEVRQAAAAFNVMRARIQRMIAQRTEMLAGVSHDIRTPLTRMKLELAMLEGPGVESLKADVAEMEHMLNEYLAFARGEGTESVAETDLGDILTDVVGGARRQGAEIALDIDRDLVVSARPNALKRCLANVVANAIAHGSHVAVHAGRDGDRIEIVVDDDGPGISPEKREEVFRPFFRVEGSRSRETGGAGLGLTIAREVMRGHGGDIVLGDSPFGGLRARLSLPV
jgi:two-component system osmolarity sensor histidine kinase EnvZ